MLTKFPEDVIVVDHDALLHVRLVRANGWRKPERVRAHRLPEGVFQNGSVTPSIADGEGFRGTIRRLVQEAGSIDAASLLLPDSWFRVTIIELASIPDRKSDANEVIRWTLRRNLPVQSEELRLAWHPVDHVEGKTRVLVFGASEKSLAGIEKAFLDEQIRVVLVEPLGVNLWNAVAKTIPDDSAHRVLFILRDREFMTAAFQGAQPLFIRSRSRGEGRSILQEVQLSASYVRTKLAASTIETCWVAGSGVERWLTDALGEEFEAPVEQVSLARIAPGAAEAGSAGHEAEVAACLGVFTS